MARKKRKSIGRVYKRGRITPYKRVIDNTVQTEGTSLCVSEDEQEAVTLIESLEIARGNTTPINSEIEENPDFYIDQEINKRYKKYYDTIETGPEYICCCCHRKQYKSNVRNIPPHIDQHYTRCILQRIQSYDNREWICNTCHKNLTKGLVPNIAVINALTREDTPDCLKDLNHVEKLLISQRIPFMKILTSMVDKQLKLKGPVVNIPAKLTPVCEVLPRIIQEDELTIVELKRNLSFKNTYLKDYVNTKKIYECLKWLKDNNHHYKNIKINEDWNPDTLDQGIRRLEIEPEDYYRIEKDNPIYTFDWLKLQKMIPDVDLKVLRENVESSNLIPKMLKFDNNILYRSFKYIVPGVKLSIQELREMCANELLKNELEYKGLRVNDYLQLRKRFPIDTKTLKLTKIAEFEQVLAMPDCPEKLKLYIDLYVKLLRGNVWPDIITLMILAVKFSINIQVITSVGSDYITTNSHTEKKSSFAMVGENLFLPLLKTKNYNRQECRIEEAKIETQVPFATCIQTDEVELVKHALIIAPGQDSEPLCIHGDPDFESKVSPWLFPTGKYALNDPSRPVKLNPRTYYAAQLEHYKGKFASDSDYIFNAQYIVESTQLLNDIQIALKRVNGTILGKPINAKLVKDPETMELLLNKNEACRFMKNLRGTPAFWSSVKLDVVALLKQIGLPSWFMTLSAAEAHWPELLKIIGREKGLHFTDHDIHKMSWDEKCNLLRESPVTVTRHFDHKVKALFREVIYDKKYNPCGQITDHFYRVEFQMRRSPHIHCLLFDDRAPRLDDNEDVKLIEYVDKYQSCYLPSKEEDYAFHNLVNSRQRHSHNRKCIRKDGTCRYDFPFLPLKRTLIIRHPESHETTIEEDNEFLELKEKVNDYINCNEDTSWDDLLAKLDLTYDKYEQLVIKNSGDKKILIKRNLNATWINFYNPVLLKIWKANMDFQFVSNAYACIVYITSYMMKAEKEMSLNLKSMVYANRSATICEQMHVSRKVYQLNREISIQESLFRLLSLLLRSCSRKIVFVNSQIKDNRSGLLKDKHFLDALEDEATDIYKTNIFDRYPLRPNDKNDMCLADFAAQYEWKEKRPESGEYFALQGTHAGFMKRLVSRRVIRTYRKTIHKSPSKYLQSLLILYCPWRDEQKFDLQTEELINLYNSVEHIVTPNQRKFENVSQFEIEKALDVFDNYYERYQETLDQSNESTFETVQDFEEHEEDIAHVDIREPPKKKQKRSKYHRTNKDGYTFKPYVMDSADYKKKYQQLNKEQQYLIDYCKNWCLKAAHCLKQGIALPPRFHLLLHAAAGCGKSFCISLILHDIYSILGKVGGVDDDDILALVTAFTGSAAFNVNGMTINSGLCIFPGDIKNYIPLCRMKLDEMRSKLSKLWLLIIDEISLVSPYMLLYISRRLQQIKGNKLPFGGVNVIVAGDLMQLSAVKQAPIYRNIGGIVPGYPEDLWSTYFKRYELTETMRQTGGIFKDILLRIRMGKQTVADLAILETRSITKIMDNYPIHTLHAFATKEEVKAHNEYVIEQLREQGTPIFEVKSKYHGNNLGTMVQTQSLLTVDCPIFLTMNIDIPEGLVNGALGYIRHFINNDQGEIDTLLVEFLDNKIGKKYKGNHLWKDNYPNCIPISRRETFEHERNNCLSIIVPDIHFPVVPGWACTIHRTQGLTLDKIVVSMRGGKSKKGRFMLGQAYVAMSRVRKLEDLFILDYDPAQIRSNQKSLDGISDMTLFEHDLYTDEWTSEKYTFGLLNFRGLQTNIKHLTYWLDRRVKYSPNFILCTETKLTSDINLPSHSDYNVLVPDRYFEARENCNVALLVKKTVNCDIVSLPINLDGFLSSIGLWHITINDTSFHIMIVYRQIQDGIERFTNVVSHLLESNHEMLSSVPLLVAGDTNIDSCKHPNNTFRKALQHFNLHWIETEYTTVYGSCLDQIYVRDVLNHSSLNVIETFFSDHCGLFFSIKA